MSINISSIQNRNAKKKFYILKEDINPLHICNELIGKINLVKTAVIQYNYQKISFYQIKEIENIVNYVIEDVKKMNKTITILFQKFYKVTKIGDITFEEKNGFYIFQNLNFSFYKKLISLEKSNLIEK